MEQNVRRMDHLPLDSVVIPDALYCRVERLARLQVQSNDVAFHRLILGCTKARESRAVYPDALKNSGE